MSSLSSPSFPALLAPAQFFPPISSPFSPISSPFPPVPLRVSPSALQPSPSPARTRGIPVPSVPVQPGFPWDVGPTRAVPAAVSESSRLAPQCPPRARSRTCPNPLRAGSSRESPARTPLLGTAPLDSLTWGSGFASGARKTPNWRGGRALSSLGFPGLRDPPQSLCPPHAGPGCRERPRGAPPAP